PDALSHVRRRIVLASPEHLLPGTDRACCQQVSPDAKTVAFIRFTQSADGRGVFRLELTDVAGGGPRVLAELRSPIALRWLSASRLFVVDDDGLAVRWFDPQ